ncbi:hypothetical protein F2P81_005585 [Scophthalmus maximus]|uniref:Uncharacterized protein n=1 Tax=Scophthalmus maximus TaxID=52904 RepID=A0A6A4T7M4_SCOMX|nr:hypothetical protein F2P81_005585 [Scophthalmus maximus]
MQTLLPQQPRFVQLDRCILKDKASKGRLKTSSVYQKIFHIPFRGDVEIKRQESPAKRRSPVLCQGAVPRQKKPHTSEPVTSQCFLGAASKQGCSGDSVLCSVAGGGEIGMRLEAKSPNLGPEMHSEENKPVRVCFSVVTVKQLLPVVHHPSHDTLTLRIRPCSRRYGNISSSTCSV